MKILCLRILNRIYRARAGSGLSPRSAAKADNLLSKRMQVVHIIGPEKGNFGAFFVVPGGFAKTFVFDRKLPTIYYSLSYSA